MSESGSHPASTAPLVVAITTVESAEAAERLVGPLLEERLIACANILPAMVSLYRWQGRVERAAEVMVLMKTPRSGIDALFARLSDLHPYEVPEMVALSVEAVSQGYGDWVVRETNEESA